VDDEGAIYITAVDSATTTISYILKCRVGETYGGPDPSYAALTVVNAISYEAAGLTYNNGEVYQPLEVMGMVVVDGTLYLTAGELPPPAMRGKVVALSSDLSGGKSTGWCGDDQPGPLPGKENEQFYFPLWFLGSAPNKLYVADFGLDLIGEKIINRVVEVNLSPLSITKVSSLPEGISFIGMSE
jgi:hypothetical protein